ncbi:glycosyl hydrolase family 65 protein [Planctomycetota bacterium]
MREKHVRAMIITSVFLFTFSITASVAFCAQNSIVLKADSFKHYVDTFNENDEELYVRHISNEKAWEFLTANIPLFECPDKDIERTYYFRWWTYRKHIKNTPDGFVITEFLPEVPWAGKHNTISCAAGHHFYEGRWLHDAKYLNDYAMFWFRGGGSPRSYSFWAADALWAGHLVTLDKNLVTELLDDLIINYKKWEIERLEPDGLFRQIDDRDGMEMSVGGSGKRATINSYMYGDAVAIAKIAKLAGRQDIAGQFREKARKIKILVQTRLWDDKAKFFKTLPRDSDTLVDVREQHGYTPWYFNLPDARMDYEAAWKQLMDPEGFYAPFGPTTAEQRHPGFKISYEGHECQWNGPSWPMSTAVTLTSMANVLNNYQQDAVSKKDYFETLKIYTKCHRLKHQDGKIVPWIDENLNPYTGDWIARTRLKSWKDDTWDQGKGGKERGKDYNHSSYCDLIISGLVGLRPQPGDIIEVNPLVPAETWDWFCLDNVLYHDRIITILWDKTGAKYGKGKGLRVFADGKEIIQSETLSRITGQLPPAERDRQTAAGWRKYEKNPVLGGKLGTCFDVSVLKEENTYRMYFSWRPKESVALVESPDGIHWNEPEIVLGPNPKSGWEGRINRPVVVKRKDGYHMWYTGQSPDRSWIGYATSDDGLAWKRPGDKPVLSAEEPWEKVAVMCPHVIWDEEKALFRMWYSGGEQYEPDAIGYAESPDGLRWTKRPSNPIFAAEPGNEWEQHKVTACQVVRDGDSYLMFYIGFKDVNRAQIGMARSRDGITGWQRYSGNPIIAPGNNTWDGDACYKPFAVYEKESERWLLWYNGRLKSVEQIGMAIHEGKYLGF